MQVISGKYKRKKLKGFDLKKTRPTMNRVKESMFAMIQDYVKESTCLDLFAGSGALGIEALSMGALKCYFVDNDKSAVKVIKDNVKGISEPTFIINKDYWEALKYFKENQISFDLIILDPPYLKEDISEIIKTICDYHLIKDKGIIVVETNQDIKNYLLCIKSKKISDKLIKIYQK